MKAMKPLYCAISRVQGIDDWVLSLGDVNHEGTKAQGHLCDFVT